MVRREGALHVTTSRRHYTDKAGQVRTYETHLLRHSFREGGKVKNKTVANLSHLPAATIDLIRASLKGEEFVSAGQAAAVARSLPHGQVAAVWAQARGLAFADLLGPACRARDIALALITARVCRPASKLATIRWWADTTLAHDLGVDDASTDEVYAAMDWLFDRQEAIEARLAARHLKPDGIAMFDLSSSWVEGRCCPLAARGYSRDSKKGRDQIEYGLLTDEAGRPVAVRTFAGNVADPAAFTEIVTVVRERFGLDKITMVGDRGMITSARIRALKDTQLGWLTALRAPQIAELAADGGPLQMSLLDSQDLAEFDHPDYPGERLIACRNPVLAEERARKRGELLEATDQLLDKIAAAVQVGRLTDPAKIGIRVGKAIGKYKMEKHYTLDIALGHFAYERDQAAIDAEAALDGIYVLRTTLTADTHDTAAVVSAYKNLANVEADFRCLKTIDLDLRPIHHYRGHRVQAHVLICMLAAYLTWHLRKTLAPLTYTDQAPPERDNPVTKARRSPAADRKAATHTGSDGQPIRSFGTLLDHLATLTRNDLRYGTSHDAVTVPTLATPTTTQRRVFDLLGTHIPLTLTTI